MADLHGNGPLARQADEDTAAREERHALLATLLGAFADGELPPETMAQVDAHLLGCARCRRELLVHRVVRQRLEAEPVPAAPSALRERIVAAVAAAPAPSLPAGAATRPSRWRVVAIALTVLALGGAAAWAWHAGRAPAVDVVSPAQPALPFPVAPLAHPSLQLIAAWTTTIDGEPAAALAYRWGGRVLLQYVVSAEQGYRAPAFRAAFAAGRALAANGGPARALAWAQGDAVSFLVGPATVGELGSLRDGVPGR
jgi:anti-sigma factor RsiW